VQLENSFTVPVPIDEAWRVLLDIERIAPCMPGAALDSVTGDDFTGRVKVKLGPINLTYQGKASFVEKDEAAHRAVIDAKGKDQRGNGTAAATITATLAEEGGATRVDVLTDLNITGRPAQFGRGVMTDVGNKLLGQFADKLAAQLGEGDVPAQSTGPAKQAAATVTGAAEEVAASAEQAGTGRARKTAAAAKKAAAGATDAVTETAGEAAAAGPAPAPAAPTKAAPAKAAPAKAAPATVAGTAPEKAPSAKAASGESAAGEAADDTAPAAVLDAEPAAASGTPSSSDRAVGAKAPSGPPGGPTAPPNRPSSTGPARTEPSVVAQRRLPASEPEPIDLLEVAGGAAMARYAAPAAGVAAAVLLVVLIVRRRRRRA
jgi:carbon monoxide dehydrogenase subunit G